MREMTARRGRVPSSRSPTPSIASGADELPSPCRTQFYANPAKAGTALISTFIAALAASCAIAAVIDSYAISVFLEIVYIHLRAPASYHCLDLWKIQFLVL